MSLILCYLICIIEIGQNSGAGIQQQGKTVSKWDCLISFDLFLSECFHQVSVGMAYCLFNSYIVESR